MPNAQPRPDPKVLKLDDNTSTQNSTRETPSTPRAPRAPSFAFTTSDGAEINNSSQIDRVSVLYFWGSWCAPCAQTSPLIEKLAKEIDDPALDVFALAIREGKPDTARDDFQRNYPTPRISVNPAGITNTFKVRVFPTIVVLDRSGSIAFQRGIERGFGAQELVEAAREAVNTALGES